MIKVWMLIFGLAGLVVQLSPAQTSLVSTGSVWKYLDDGSDQGSAWQGLFFDDTAWASGPAQLGFGGGDEATVINGGPETNRFLTTYFRCPFVVTALLEVTNLVVRLLRTDGALVYLNGTEIIRSNMPTNDLLYDTPASGPARPGDGTTNSYARAVDPALLLPGTNVLAVEMHQFSSDSTGLSFDLSLMGNSVAIPPVVAITSPTNGTDVLTAHLSIIAEAHDEIDTIALVEFFNEYGKLGEAAVPPYGMVCSNVAQGTHTLTAVATDSLGLSSTSAPVEFSVTYLIPSGADWRYLDDGSDQGISWRGLGFDDSGWSNGPAQLGYGDGDEATIIHGGPVSDRFITYYFRHPFYAASPGAFTNLVLRLLRDDGGIVYLNGTEVFRSNMPDGPVDYLTWAASVVPNGPQESTFYSTHVDPALLVAGTNVLAVEIHQANNTSEDVSFDLELVPNVPPTPPTVSITSPAPMPPGLVAPAMLQVDVAASDYDGTVSEVEIYLNDNEGGSVSTEPFSLTFSNLAVGDYTILAVARDSFGLSATSAPVAFTVVGGPILTTLIATGSVWKYLDDGTNQGTAWKEVAFNDSGWAFGPALLGWGNATKVPPRVEATLIRKNVTDYFRHRFVAANASSFTNLGFRVLRDDGVVVYLNGTEIFRMNMPDGPIGYATNSLTVVGGANETNYFSTNLGPGLLINGTNLLAVELHQVTSAATDGAFDLELIGTAPPVSGPIALSIQRSGAEIMISWTANGAVLQQAGAVAGPWTTLTNSSPYQAAPAGLRSFFRLRKP